MLDDGFETEEDRKKEAEFEHARRAYVDTYGVEPAWHTASREDPQVAELCRWFGTRAAEAEKRLKRLVELNAPTALIAVGHRLAGAWWYAVYFTQQENSDTARQRAWKHMQEAVRLGAKDFGDDGEEVVG